MAQDIEETASTARTLRFTATVYAAPDTVGKNGTAVAPAERALTGTRRKWNERDSGGYIKMKNGKTGCAGWRIPTTFQPWRIRSMM